MWLDVGQRRERSCRGEYRRPRTYDFDMLEVAD
jgi:hypothetical protein